MSKTKTEKTPEALIAMYRTKYMAVYGWPITNDVSYLRGWFRIHSGFDRKVIRCRRRKDFIQEIDEMTSF